MVCNMPHQLDFTIDQVINFLLHFTNVEVCPYAGQYISSARVVCFHFCLKLRLC